MVRTPLSPQERMRGERLGALLRSARGARSMAEIAALSGVPVETLRKIETGRIPTPAFFTVASLAYALDLDLADIVAYCAGGPSPKSASASRFPRFGLRPDPPQSPAGGTSAWCLPRGSAPEQDPSKGGEWGRRVVWAGTTTRRASWPASPRGVGWACPDGVQTHPKGQKAPALHNRNASSPYSYMSRSDP